MAATARPLLARSSTASQRRVGDADPLTRTEVLASLDDAQPWMLESLSRHSHRWVWRFLGVDPVETVEKNFAILRKYFNSDEAKCIGYSDKHACDQDHELTIDQAHMVEDLVVGPAVPYAIMCNRITWGCFVLLCCIVPHAVDYDQHGIAEPPAGAWLALCIVMWICATGYTLLFELVAALYVVPTQLIYKDDHKLLGLDVSFGTWIAYKLLLSFVLHTDIYTTAIFIGRVMASSWMCSELQQQWNLALSHSKFLPSSLHVHFWKLTLLAAFVMFGQVLYSLAYSIPMSPDISKYAKLSRENPKYELVETGSIKHTAVYDTFQRKLAGHGRCCAALAESGRMMCLNWNDDDYLNEAENHWDCLRVHQEMRRANVRFFMFFLQSILMTNLQITFLGVKRNANDGDADWLTQGSPMLTVVLMVKYIVYEIQSNGNHNKLCSRALRQQEKYALELDNKYKLREDRLDELNSTDRSQSPNKINWEATRIERLRARSHGINRCISVVAVFLLAYTLTKAFMAMAGCPHGTSAWNVPNRAEGFFNLTAGCVMSYGNLTDCSGNFTAFHNESFVDETFNPLE